MSEMFSNSPRWSKIVQDGLKLTNMVSFKGGLPHIIRVLLFHSLIFGGSGDHLRCFVAF